MRPLTPQEEAEIRLRVKYAMQHRWSTDSRLLLAEIDRLRGAHQALIAAAVEEAWATRCRPCSTCGQLMRVAHAAPDATVPPAQADEPSRRSEVLAALAELRINANRLCDRNLGGTYEEDCRRSIARADAALKGAEQPTCSTCRWWEPVEDRSYGDCINDDVRDQCSEPPFLPVQDFSCKFHKPKAVEEIGYE